MVENAAPDTFYVKYGKRGMDFFLSFLALIILSPVLLVLAVLVRIKLGSPVLFSQERPGKNEKLFKLYKFRTMTNERDENGRLLDDNLRLTKFGRMLRATSLDELPELVNILKGDMSLVGPRPLLAEYLPLYNESQRKRHSIRPGLTGLAQVSGRNTLSWEERFVLDIQYVKTIRLKEDVSIILKTLKKVVQREGIHSEASATMEDFKGTK